MPPMTPDVEGQEVEEERAVGLGLEAHHLAARAGAVLPWIHWRFVVFPHRPGP